MFFKSKGRKQTPPPKIDVTDNLICLTLLYTNVFIFNKERKLKQFFVYNVAK